jgi:hypothetical protein
MLRRTELKRGAPLKRGKPLARKPMKRTRKKAASADEKRHMDRVAALGCLISGKPATLHHVSSTIHGARITRSHKRIVPLAPEYHLIQHGPKTSVEALGHLGFFERYGIDLLAVADALWAETQSLGL